MKEEKDIKEEDLSVKEEAGSDNVFISGRKDLTNYFQNWDHSLNNVHSTVVRFQFQQTQIISHVKLS